jgi:hypothetical protein
MSDYKQSHLILLIMKTKFIEGTNEQYSIREDGIVIKHYYLTYNQYLKTPKILNKISYPAISKITNVVSITLSNNKHKSFAVATLLKNYFGFYYCKSCNTKVFSKQFRYSVCKKCRNKKHIKFRSKHTERYINYDKEKISNISKSYAACSLRINMSELPDDLYELHKVQLLVKRKLVEKTGLSIYNFNK